jgi:hypothetical protein
VRHLPLRAGGARIEKTKDAEKLGIGHGLSLRRRERARGMFNT